MKTLADIKLPFDIGMKGLMQAKNLPTIRATPQLPTKERTLRYTGQVTREMNERILKKMEHLIEGTSDEIALFITSPGGTTGNAMSFYDTVRHILQPSLVTIGSGDVDSSGIIIFLSGQKRLISARTTLLMHPAGRFFGTQRYTTREMESMLNEDRLKDQQYAALVAENSHGHLTSTEVLHMMEQHTVLSPKKLVELGLADAILS
jgi:ATP-dependent protease ClpP protease subunit